MADSDNAAEMVEASDMGRPSSRPLSHGSSSRPRSYRYSYRLVAHDSSARPISYDPSSRPLSEYLTHVNTPTDRLSLKSKASRSEAEEGIEEAFAPARDEASGFHQHGGHHADEEEPEAKAEADAEPEAEVESSLVEWDGPDLSLIHI